MSNKKNLSEKFAFLGSEFLAELDNCAVIAEIKARTEIIAPGQRINNIPILLSGSVKGLYVERRSRTAVLLHKTRRKLYYDGCIDLSEFYKPYLCLCRRTFEIRFNPST